MQEPPGKVWEAVKRVQGECRRLQDVIGVWRIYRLGRNAEERGRVTKGRRLRKRILERARERKLGVVGGFKSWELK